MWVTPTTNPQLLPLLTKPPPCGGTLQLLPRVPSHYSPQLLLLVTKPPLCGGTPQLLSSRDKWFSKLWTFKNYKLSPCGGIVNYIPITHVSSLLCIGYALNFENCWHINWNSPKYGVVILKIGHFHQIKFPSTHNFYFYLADILLYQKPLKILNST